MAGQDEQTGSTGVGCKIALVISAIIVAILAFVSYSKHSKVKELDLALLTIQKKVNEIDKLGGVKVLAENTLQVEELKKKINELAVAQTTVCTNLTGDEQVNCMSNQLAMYSVLLKNSNVAMFNAVRKYYSTSGIPPEYKDAMFGLIDSLEKFFAHTDKLFASLKAWMQKARSASDAEWNKLVELCKIDDFDPFRNSPDKLAEMFASQILMQMNLIDSVPVVRATVGPPPASPIYSGPSRPHFKAMNGREVGDLSYGINGALDFSSEILFTVLCAYILPIAKGILSSAKLTGSALREKLTGPIDKLDIEYSRVKNIFLISQTNYYAAYLGVTQLFLVSG